MGHSRASKEQLKSGGSVDKWMQRIEPNIKKGALHKEMHIPQDKKIPTKKLEKAKHSENPLLKKRATLALNYRGG